MREHIIGQEKHIRGQLWHEQGQLRWRAVAISIEEDTVEWARQASHDLSGIATGKFNQLAQPHPAQIRVCLSLFVCITVDTDHPTTGDRCCPGQPDRTVAIGGANLKQTRTSTTANEDAQKLSRLWLQIQHLLAALLLLGIVLLPCFVQLGQEDANINISHGFSLLTNLSLARRLMASRQQNRISQTKRARQRFTTELLASHVFA